MQLTESFLESLCYVSQIMSGSGKELYKFNFALLLSVLS